MLCPRMNFTNSISTVVISSWEKWLHVRQDHVTEKFHSNPKIENRLWSTARASFTLRTTAAAVSCRPRPGLFLQHLQPQQKVQRKQALTLNTVNCRLASNVRMKSNLCLVLPSLHYPKQSNMACAQELHVFTGSSV